MRLFGIFIAHGGRFARLCNIRFFLAQRQLLHNRPAGVIVDAGANVGNTVVVYADLFPEAIIFAMEPFPPAYERLHSRFQNEPRIRAFPIALADKSGPAVLHLNEYADTNSLLPRPERARRYYAADNHPRGTLGVPIARLDEFAEEHKLSRIDILKMDLQGGEAAALAGACCLLESGRIDLIYAEVLFAPDYEGAWLFHEITEYLTHFGYTVYNLYHLATAQNGQLRFGDALYVSSRIRRDVLDTSPPEP